MSKQKRFSASKKVEIIREHLENKVSISHLSEEYEVSPNLLYYWKKQLFEGALQTFGPKRSQKQPDSQSVKELEAKLHQRETLISEIVSENIKLKKNLNGEI